MIIFIKNLKKIADEKYSIGYIHYCPLNKEYGYKINGCIATKKDLEKEGIVVEIPEEIINEHENDIMYYNPIKKDIFWEKDNKQQIELKETNEMEKMQQRIEALEQSNAELMNLIMMQNLK